MIESYALMIMVMGTFFIYFCGMVWAFSNPKLSGAEEESVAEAEATASENCVCAQNPQERIYHLADAHRGAQQKTGDWLTQTTYINFCEDTDSLMSDRTRVCCENHGGEESKSEDSISQLWRTLDWIGHQFHTDRLKREKKLLSPGDIALLSKQLVLSTLFILKSRKCSSLSCILSHKIP